MFADNSAIGYNPPSVPRSRPQSLNPTCRYRDFGYLDPGQIYYRFRPPPGEEAKDWNICQDCFEKYVRPSYFGQTCMAVVASQANEMIFCSFSQPDAVTPWTSSCQMRSLTPLINLITRNERYKEKLIGCPAVTASYPEARTAKWYVLNEDRGVPVDQVTKICEACHFDCLRDSGLENYFTVVETQEPAGAPRPSIQCMVGNVIIRGAVMLGIAVAQQNIQIFKDFVGNLKMYQSCQSVIPTTSPHFRLCDLRTGQVYPDFSVCEFCFFTGASYFPHLKVPDDWVKIQPEQGQVALNCTISPARPLRMVAYQEQLMISYWKHDPSLFRKYVEEFSSIKPCKKMVTEAISGGTWYDSPQVPELDACEECYNDVIKSSVFESQFHKQVKPPEVTSVCILFAMPVRRYYAEACQSNDLATFAIKLAEFVQRVIAKVQSINVLKQEIQLLQAKQKMQAQQQNNQWLFGFKQASIGAMNINSTGHRYSVGGGPSYNTSLEAQGHNIMGNNMAMNGNMVGMLSYIDNKVKNFGVQVAELRSMLNT